MKSIKTILLGIAVILFGGVLMIDTAVSAGEVCILIGLALAVIGFCRKD